MATTFNGRRKIRKSFGSIREVTEMPNLIEVQKASYDQFLLVDEPKGGRPEEGLQAVFKSVFPITDFSNTASLEFVKYEFEAPKYDVDECRQRDMTFAAPLKVTLRLDRVRSRRGDRRPLRQGHQGAGRLHGRHAVHDHERHFHRQRHRARHRLPDAPLARRVLRPRQGQDPFFRQAAVCRPHHSLSRLLARHRVRRQGHRLRAHRPPPLWAIKRFSEIGAKATGYPAISIWHDFKYHPKDIISGTQDWVYEHLGALFWVVEIWGAERRGRHHPAHQQVDRLVSPASGRGRPEAHQVERRALQRPGPRRLEAVHASASWRSRDRRLAPPVLLAPSAAAPARARSRALPEVDDDDRALVAQLGLLADRGARARRYTWRVRIAVANSGWLPAYATKRALARITV